MNGRCRTELYRFKGKMFATAVYVLEVYDGLLRKPRGALNFTQITMDKVRCVESFFPSLLHG